MTDFPWHFHQSIFHFVQKFQPLFYREESPIPWRFLTFGTTAICTIHSRSYIDEGNEVIATEES